MMATGDMKVKDSGVVIEKLTREAYAPYGDVIAAPDVVSGGNDSQPLMWLKILFNASIPTRAFNSVIK